jgi:excisionase family DNA binding protein
MDTKQAAEYVGVTVAALHRHTAARTIPFEQDAPGGKCWFKRSELDDWRRGERAT